MAIFGSGYGSECHLLRNMARHRARLDEAVAQAIDANEVQWLDFPFAGTGPDPKGGQRRPDVEWRSLDFLPDDSEAVRTWKHRWPHGGGVMNWDGVGQVVVDGRTEWLLVEAKAHLQEIGTKCTAMSTRLIKRIEAALGETKSAVGAPPEADWMNGYYQYANRLAVLEHLTRHGFEARLLFNYFCGDARPDSFVYPQSEDEWSAALMAQEQHLGLPGKHCLSGSVHIISACVGRVAPMQ